ncbi:24995_t:CDS:1, partial [Racocetra persica]
ERKKRLFLKRDNCSVKPATLLIWAKSPWDAGSFFACQCFLSDRT